MTRKKSVGGIIRSQLQVLPSHLLKRERRGKVIQVLRKIGVGVLKFRTIWIPLPLRIDSWIHHYRLHATLIKSEIWLNDSSWLCWHVQIKLGFIQAPFSWNQLDTWKRCQFELTRDLWSRGWFSFFWGSWS